MNRDSLAIDAARAAARLRADHQIAADQAVCPFDLAEANGVMTRLVGLSSLEGMYSPEPRPAIVMSAERPAGRQRYTCGHELGHHVFRHGTRLDELMDDGGEGWLPEEYMAHRFAAALLMPKIAVDAAFARRGSFTNVATADMFFIVAQDLGVGFSTLVRHVNRTMRAITPSTANNLCKIPLPRLRAQLAGFKVEHDVFVVDEHWGARPLDLEVDDVVLVPREAEIDAPCLAWATEPRPHLKAAFPGCGTVILGRRYITVRVSRRGFTGLARYRHLQEQTDE